MMRREIVLPNVVILKTERKILMDTDIFNLFSFVIIMIMAWTLPEAPIGLTDSHDR
jgi:hypothetical protein